jgi:hypothetical protein
MKHEGSFFCSENSTTEFFLEPVQSGPSITTSALKFILILSPTPKSPQVPFSWIRGSHDGDYEDH